MIKLFLVKIQISQNDFPMLRRKLLLLEQGIPEVAHTWTRRSIENLDSNIRENLKTQGRSSPPPLSSATRKIYSATGGPNGSGIRNHIELSYYNKNGKITALLGIAPGKPTIVAKTQEYGCTIRVTQKMRGYLARFGIYLRAETKFIRIPARHFWSKANIKANREAKEDLKRLFRQLANSQ